MLTRSITESPNPLTINIDVADPVGIVRLLRQSDAQMFSGYDVYASLMDEEIIEKLALVGWRIAQLVKSEDNRIFLGGAGTSGRFAHLHCLLFNRILREKRLPEIFRPLIAGGEAALIQAQESAEDSAAAAVRDVKAELFPDLERGLYIGITAGVSAPYVAAQLDFLGGNPAFESVVVGFNPAEFARDKPIEGWDKTVKQVIDQALESDRFTLLNPVYGPEPVTGSTRMKGGSMTKIVIETAFATALEILEYESQEGAPKLSESNLLPVRQSILERIRRYQETVNAAYGNVAGLAELVRLAGTALRAGGRINYLGRGIAALLGIIDASECPPTYGADPIDVRGFIREGWEFLGYNPTQMKARGKAYEIDHEAFEKSVLPDIQKGDLVIAVAIQTLGENTRRLLEAAAAKRATTALLLVSTEKPRPGSIPESVRHYCPIDVPYQGMVRGTTNEAELALKLCLNAITTGAHIMAGKVFTNVMIDLKISNSKLYDRAVGLVSQLSGADTLTSRRALHQAIFKEPPASDAAMDAVPMQTIISKAMAGRRVVALAILLASGKIPLDAALKRLEEEPRVRRLIEAVVRGEA